MYNYLLIFVHSVQKKLYSLWSLPVYKSRPMGYTIITPREHDLPGQAKRTRRVERNSKKFKKGLDKNKGLWYTLRVRSNEPNDKKEVMCMMKMTYALALELAMTALSNDQTVPYVYTTSKVVDGERQSVTERAEVPMTEVKEKLTALLASLDKKASTEKKPTKTQQENAEVAQTLYDEMLACGKALTVSDMLAEFECVKGMSNQKVSALVRKLKDAGKVEKSVEGRKSFFKALA